MYSEMAEKILKAADALIVERGYSAFSYADVSGAVGIRKASIHHHFPTKAGLAVAVLRAHRQRLLHGAEILDTQVEDPLGRLQEYIRYWEGCIRGKTVSFCLAALLGAEMLSLPEEVQAEVRLHFATLGSWIERTLEAGVKKHVITLQGTAATEAQTLMALIHGGMLSARGSSDCEVFGTITDAALKRLSTATH